MRYVFAECVLDTQLYSLYRAGTTVQLRPKAFHVLQYLLEHRDHVVNKDELCAHVWPGQFISDATLEGCITLARQAVGDSGRAQRLILEIEDLHWSDATSEEWLAAGISAILAQHIICHAASSPPTLPAGQPAAGAGAHPRRIGIAATGTGSAG